MTAFLLSLFWGLQSALADEVHRQTAIEEPQVSLRLGVCAGFDASCLLIGGKIEVTTRFLGLQIAGPIPQATLKFYPLPIVRIYVYGATSVADIGIAAAGGGFGCDVHVPGIEQVIFQTQYGSQYSSFDSGLGSSRGVNGVYSFGFAIALGKAPRWSKWVN